MDISNSSRAAAFLRRQMRVKESEEFWVVALNSLCNVIEAEMLFRGTVDSCQVHPRDIFRFGLLTNASSMLLGHNHPSASCLPSVADIQLTRKLKKAGELLQIPITDHIIVTIDSHFSFAENKWGLPS